MTDRLEAAEVTEVPADPEHLVTLEERRERAWHEIHLQYVRIAELNAIVGRLQAHEAAHTSLQGTAERLQALQAAHETLNQSHADVVAERDALADRLHAVQQSTAWKVTWPLRQALTRYPGSARLLRRLATAVWRAGTLQLHRTARDPALFEGRAGSSAEPPPVTRQVEEVPPAPPLLAAPQWRVPHAVDRYQSWLSFNQPTARSDRDLRRRLEDTVAAALPTFSVAMTVYEPDPTFLRQAVASVQSQIYAKWELCIADDASSDPEVGRYLQSLTADPRIKIVMRLENGHISAATNSAAGLAAGDFIVLLDHDDELAPEALAELALYVAEHAETDLIYSDADKIDEDGHRSAPHFKPSFAPEMLLSYMYAGQTLCVRTSLWQQLGGMRIGYEGSQDHDFALRASEVARHIGHVERVLYHWRSSPGSTASSGTAKPYSFEAGRRAVQDALTRRGSRGIAEHPEWARRIGNGIFGVAFPDNGPPVTVMIPSRHDGAGLRRCIESLRTTRYADFDILVLDADAGDAEYLTGLACLPGRGTISRTERVGSAAEPASFSQIVNDGARHATGEYIVLLGDDLEVLDPAWLSSLVGYAQLEGVGAVGGLLRLPDGRVQQAGRVRPPGPVGAAFQEAEPSGAGYLSTAQYAQNTSAVIADCMLVSREAFLAVGGFDEARFGSAYYDIDFCYRLSERRLRHVYTPDAELRHQDHAAPSRFDDSAELASFVSLYRQRRDPYLNPSLGGDPLQLAIQPRVAPTGQATPLRVVFCSHNLNLEGAPKALFDICVHLKRTGRVEPLVYSPRDGSLRREYDRAGIKVVVGPAPVERGPELADYEAGLAAISQVFKYWNAEIVAANTLQSFYAIDAAREAGIPSVWNIHESEGWRGYFHSVSREVEQRALACFGHPYRVVYVAHATQLLYAELDYHHNATVISGGIDAAALTEGLGPDARARARARLRISPTRLVLLTVGTVGERKGQLDAVEAFERLAPTTNVMLLIVGDVSGPYSAALHTRVEAMAPGLRSRVVIVGERDDISAYYAAADVFVFCSRMESYPRVIMEAMAFGLPIVTTPVNGIPEQVQDGANARFYQPGDIAVLTQHLRELTTDAALRKTYGERSRARLQSLNSAVDVAEAHGRLFREAALSSVPPSRVAEFDC